MAKLTSNIEQVLACGESIWAAVRNYLAR